MNINKKEARKAFQSLARTMGKSTIILSTDFSFIPGTWRFESFEGGKVQVVEIVDENGKSTPVTEKLSMREFVTVVNQMKLLKKKEMVHG